MSINLKILSERIRNDIDRHCVELYAESHRNHLGASVIGHDCEAYIWLAFRWARKEIFSGRMLRLFNRGHREEQRCIEYLKGIGFNIYDAPNNEQFRIVGYGGHYGGSTDSIGTTPYKDFPEPMVLEFKTHNSKSFADLKDKGLLRSKPRHYAQMCSYGQTYGYKNGLYYAVGKNDDDIHIEVVKLDYTQAEYLHTKADKIIRSMVLPPRIALQETYFECKMCPFVGVCHRGERLDISCRSCFNAEPIDNGQWFCRHFQQTIPTEFIPKGCTNWKSIL